MWTRVALLLLIIISLTLSSPDTFLVNSQTSLLSAIRQAKDSKLTIILVNSSFEFSYTSPIIINGTKNIEIRSSSINRQTINVKVVNPITESGTGGTFMLTASKPFRFEQLTPPLGNRSLAYSGGDFNGDGLSDLIWLGPSGLSIGRGGSNLNALEHTGIFLPRNSSGYRSFSIGDVNGDGFEDIAFVENAPTLLTLSLIFGGQLARNPKINLVITIPFSAPNRGLMPPKLVKLGDVNGDHIEDFAVTFSNNKTSNSSLSPSIYIVYGSSEFGNTFYFPDALSPNFLKGGYVFLENPSKYLASQYQVSAAGDLDGDGIGDFIVGNSIQDFQEFDPSEIYIFFGKSSQRANGDVSFSSTSNNTLRIFDPAKTGFGGAIHGGGDFNGDGFPDILVGGVRTAFLNDLKIIWGGQFWGQRFSSSSNAPNIPISSLVTTTLKLACALTNVTHADFDLDGYSDILIGCDFTSAPYQYAIIWGSPALIKSTNIDVTTAGGLYFKHGRVGFRSFEPVGDLDGDKFPDLYLQPVDGFRVFESTNKYVFFSPGKLRNDLQTTSGLFRVQGNSFLSLENLRIVGTLRAVSVQGNSSSFLVKTGCEFYLTPYENGKKRVCPLYSDSKTCLACPLGSKNSNCPRFCEETKAIATSQLTIVAGFSLNTFEIAYSSTNKYMIAYFVEDSVQGPSIRSQIGQGSNLDNCLKNRKLNPIYDVASARHKETDFGPYFGQYTGSNAYALSLTSVEDRFYLFYLNSDFVLFVRKVQQDETHFSNSFLVTSLSEDELRPSVFTSTDFRLITSGTKSIGSGAENLFVLLSYFVFSTGNTKQLILNGNLQNGFISLPIISNRYSTLPTALLTSLSTMPNENTVYGNTLYSSCVNTNGNFLVAFSRLSIISFFLYPNPILQIADTEEQVVVGLKMICSKHDGQSYLLFNTANQLGFAFFDGVRWGSAKIVTSFSTPFPVNSDLVEIANKQLIIAYTNSSHVLFSNYSTDGQNILLSATRPRENFSPSFASRALWLSPSLDFIFYGQFMYDPINRRIPISADVRSSEIVQTKGIPVSSTLFVSPIDLLPKRDENVCSFGWECLFGERFPCSNKNAGYYQETITQNCSSSKICEPLFWCGPGANIKNYRQSLIASTLSIQLDVVKPTKTTYIWKLTNVEPSTIRIKLQSSIPDWISLVIANGVDILSQGYGYPIESGKEIEIRIIVNSESFTGNEITTSLPFLWFIEEEKHFFPFSVDLFVRVVDILISPSDFQLTVSNTTATYTSTIYNILPFNFVTVNVIPCKEVSFFKFIQGQILTKQLAPGIGDSLNVSFEIDPSTLQLNENITQAANRYLTCFTFNITTDTLSSVTRQINISVIHVQDCPKNSFSSTGKTSLEFGCTFCGDFAFQPNIGQKSCLPAEKCLAGFYSRTGYELKPDEHVKDCKPCPPGFIQPNEGSINCIPCSRGTYNTEYGETSCVNCPDTLPLTYGVGITNVSECQPSPGYFRSVDEKGSPIGQVCPLFANCTEPHGLEDLPINLGAWRATPSSLNILPCRIAHYCIPEKPVSTVNKEETRRRQLQQTFADTYCAEGHQGLLCEGCQIGFAKRGTGKVCQPCNNQTQAIDDRSAAIYLFFVLLVPFLAFVLILTVKNRVKSNFPSAEPTFSDYAGTCFRRTWEILVDLGMKAKLIIGLFQVIGSISVNFEYYLPPAFANMASQFSVFYVDVTNSLNIGCSLSIADQQFYKALLVATIGPFIAIIYLFVVGRITMYCIARYESKRRLIIKTVFQSVVLLTLFLIYPGVSNIIIRTFICSPPFDDGRSALVADYGVVCDETWSQYVIYAGIMAFFYIACIPIITLITLISKREHLNHANAKWYDRDNEKMKESVRHRLQSEYARPLFFFIQGYHPFFYFWDPIDLFVRLLQTSVLVVFYPIWGQLIFQICVTISYLVILTFFNPYLRGSDLVISVSAQLGILTISLTTLVFYFYQNFSISCISSTTNSNGIKERFVGMACLNVTAGEFFCFAATFVPLLLLFPAQYVHYQVKRHEVGPIVINERGRALKQRVFQELMENEEIVIEHVPNENLDELVLEDRRV